MVKSIFVMSVFVSALAISCGTQQREVAVIRPVKVVTAEPVGAIDKSFSGVVMPDQFSDLAFKVGGPLVTLNVVEGQHVRKGEVVAEIDPLDYRLQYEAKRSSYLTAKSQLERAEKLLAKDAISRQDYESTRASYDNSKAAFENAESQLQETKLKAPFDGFIQQKYVENYQKVQQGTSIVCLVDPNLLQIRFTMPETNLAALLARPELYVEFENYRGIQFKAKIKEYVPASADGSGVPVFLYINDPRFNLRDYNVAVGFTCRVTLRSENALSKSAYAVPVSAIVAVADQDAPHLYVYNPQDSTVHLRRVVGDEITGRGSVIVTEGLTAGEQIVTAGSTRLKEGQQVKILTE